MIRLLKRGLCYTVPRAISYIVFSSVCIEMCGPELGFVSLVKPCVHHRVKLHRCVILPTRTRHEISMSAVCGSH